MEVLGKTEIVTTIGTFLLIVGAIVGFVVKFTSLKDKLEYRITNAEEKNKEQEQEITLLTTKINNADITFMEIRTKLANIEALLIDMKAQIKNK